MSRSLASLALVGALLSTAAVAADTQSAVDGWLLVTYSDAATAEGAFCSDVRGKDSSKGADRVEEERQDLANEGRSLRAKAQQDLAQLNRDRRSLVTSRDNRKAAIEQEHKGKIEGLEAEVKAARPRFEAKEAELATARERMQAFESDGAVDKAKGYARTLLDEYEKMRSPGAFDTDTKEFARRERCQKALADLKGALGALRDLGVAVPRMDDVILHEASLPRWDSLDNKTEVENIGSHLDRQWKPAADALKALENDPDIKRYAELEKQLEAARNDRTKALANDQELKDLDRKIQDIDRVQKPPLERGIEAIDAHLSALDGAAAGLRECIRQKKLEFEGRKTRLLAEKKALTKDIIDDLKALRERLREKVKKARDEAYDNSTFVKCHKLYVAIVARIKELHADDADLIERLGARDSAHLRAENKSKRTRLRARWDGSGCRLPKDRAAAEQEVERRKEEARREIREARDPVLAEARAEWSAAKARAAGRLETEVQGPLRKELPEAASDYSEIDKEIDTFTTALRRVIERWRPSPANELKIDAGVLGFPVWANPDFGDETSGACLDLAEAATTKLDALDQDLATKLGDVKRGLADERRETADRECESLREKARIYNASDPKSPAVAEEIRQESERFERLYGARQEWKNERQVLDKAREDIQEVRDGEATDLENRKQELEDEGCGGPLAAVSDELEEKARDLGRAPSEEDLKLPDLKLTCELDASAFFVLFESSLPMPLDTELPWHGEALPVVPPSPPEAKARVERQREEMIAQRVAWVDQLTYNSFPVRPFPWWSPVLSFSGEDVLANYQRDKFVPGGQFALEFRFSGEGRTIHGGLLLTVLGVYDSAGEAVAAAPRPPSADDGTEVDVEVLAVQADGSFVIPTEDGGSASGRLWTDGWTPRSKQLALEFTKEVLKLAIEFGKCFVATAVYGDPSAPELATLRRFRDEVLAATWAGRRIIDWYYRNGPALAEWVRDKPRLRAALRFALDRFTGWLESRDRGRRDRREPEAPPAAGPAGR